MGKAVEKGFKSVVKGVGKVFGIKDSGTPTADYSDSVNDLNSSLAETKKRRLKILGTAGGYTGEEVKSGQIGLGGGIGRLGR